MTDKAQIPSIGGIDFIGKPEVRTGATPLRFSP
jgi:hypothetical protein